MSISIHSEIFSNHNSVHYPPVASLLRSSKGNEYVDNRLSRILTGNPINRKISNSHSSINQVPNFFCRQQLNGLPLNNSLVCSCAKGEQQLIDISKGSFGWSTINNQPKNVSKLYLFFCKFSIGHLAIKSLNLNSLTDLYIAETEYLMLYDDSLDFSSSKKVRVTISRVDNLVFLPRLHASVSTLVLDSLIISDLSTDKFIPSHIILDDGLRYKVGNVVIQNCLIEMKDRNVESRKHVELRSLIFDNVTFTSAPTYQFLNILVTTQVVFKNMALEASNRGIIQLKAEKLLFQNCIIKNWRPHAIKAVVDHVIFNRTTLQEPQRHAIMDVTFLGNKSVLELIDVTLDDPAEGTLLTKFPIVNIENIFVKRCKCDLVEYLIKLPENVVSRLSKNISNFDNNTLSRQKMEIDLSQEIKCHPLNNPSSWVHPSRNCNKEIIIEKEVENWDSKSLAGIFVGLFFIAVLVIFFLVYFSRKKEKKKIELVKNWQFHDPEEVQTVDDSKQYICYLSQLEENSTTTIFSTLDVNVEMREPNLHNSHKNSFYESLQPVNPAYTRKGCNSLDELSRGGSMVIHEDSD